VNAVVSVQHTAAADGSVFSLSCRRVRMMLLHLSRRLSLGPPTVHVPGSDAPLLARPPYCHVAGSHATWMRLYPSAVQLPLLTASPVRWSCSCLDVSRSTLPLSTLVCPSTVDAALCSSTVLSLSWWSVDVDATVTVQRTVCRLGIPTLGTINTTATVTDGA
jgi:hypothetical protein